MPVDFISVCRQKIISSLKKIIIFMLCMQTCCALIGTISWAWLTKIMEGTSGGGNIARARASLQEFVKTHIPEADLR